MIEIGGEQKTQELISIFICEKDRDVENFLKEKAIIFEECGKSRTFFIFDEDSTTFSILAYFTLAIQVLKIPNELSGRKIKNLDGCYSKRNGMKITELPAILIGQIGKNSSFSKFITGSEIIEYCLATILKGQNYLSGRIIMLECKNVEYLIDLYGRFGFEKVDKDYEDEELFQMIRVLSDEEIIESNIKNWNI